jgi:hypothetical protein
LNTTYKRIKATDKPSAHWYTRNDLANCVHTHVSNGLDLPLPDFISGFAKLGNRKTAIAQAVGVSYLSEIDDNGIDELLDHLQAAAPAPAPGVLGSLGKEHIQQSLDADDESFRYKMISDSFERAEATIPFVLEAAFTWNGVEREVLIGLNNSVTYKPPFTDYLVVSKGSKTWTGWGLMALLEEFEVEGVDLVTVVIHLVCPSLQFTNKAKTELDTEPFDDALLRVRRSEGNNPTFFPRQRLANGTNHRMIRMDDSMIRMIRHHGGGNDPLPETG